MKLKIQLSKDTFVTVNFLLQKSLEIHSCISEDSKIILSIIYSTLDFFNKKLIKTQREKLLFNPQKKHQITLKYHEGWALKEYLITTIVLLDNKYETICIQQLINQLDQKLK